MDYKFKTFHNFKQLNRENERPFCKNSYKARVTTLWTSGLEMKI